MHFSRFLAGIIVFVAISCNSVSKKEYHDPEKLWGELYRDVTAAKLFSDPKEFWDAAPKGKAEKLLQFYLQAREEPGFDLQKFVSEYFTVPDYSVAYPVSREPFETYVASAFRSLLTRPKDDGGSLIPTRMRYLSGGGMFPEYNYYRSFFAVKAFQSLKEDSLAADIATNAFQFIQDYGYVPYGNRSYYLGFSGFPVLSLMAEAVAEKQPALLPWYGNLMARDYQNWMAAGDKEIPSAGSYRSVVVLKDGKTLNRFYSVGKPNRYISFLKTTEWEGSSRFYADGKQDPSRFLPVDLNAALYHFEQVLSASFSSKDRQEYAASYKSLGAIRKDLFDLYFYHPEKKYYYDYDYVSGKMAEAETLAGVFPLLTGLCNKEQAGNVVKKIEQHFLTENGVLNDISGVYGSAEMNYLTILALRKAGREDLAEVLKFRWLKLNKEYFSKQGHILAVYNLRDPGSSPKTPARTDGALAVLTALLNE